MQYLGDISPGDTLDFKFTTAGADGVPTALTSGTISVYKDNSTTQSTSGVTLSASFDSVTGLNNVRITTASDGSFYSAGSNFQVIITAGTVDGTSVVGYVVGSFSIRARAAYAEIVSRIGTNGAGLTALPWNSAWDAEVQSECTDALNAYDPPTNAEMNARTLASASYATSTAVAAIKAKTDLIPGTTDGYTFAQLVTLIAAAILGKASGLDTTTATFRSLDDTKDRITATIDSDGNRSAVTLDAS